MRGAQALNKKTLFSRQARLVGLQARRSNLQKIAGAGAGRLKQQALSRRHNRSARDSRPQLSPTRHAMPRVTVP